MNSLEHKINRLSIAKKGIDNEPTNDNILTHFHNAFLDLLDEKPILTENGYSMLYYDPEKDLHTINKPDNIRQKPLTRFCIFLTIAYNLNKIYCGLIENISTYPHIYESIPTEIKDCLEDVKTRSINNQDPMKNLLNYYVNKLSDKYAKIYNQEKMRCFVKDIFGNRDNLKMPTPEIDEIQKTARATN